MSAVGPGPSRTLTPAVARGRPRGSCALPDYGSCTRGPRVGKGASEVLTSGAVQMGGNRGLKYRRHLPRQLECCNRSSPITTTRLLELAARPAPDGSATSLHS